MPRKPQKRYESLDGKKTFLIMENFKHPRPENNNPPNYELLPDAVVDELLAEADRLFGKKKNNPI